MKRLLPILLFVFIFSGCATVPYQPQVMPPGGIYHIVGSGQTLYRISKTYGVGIKEIMRLNNIRDPNYLGVGDRLFIPRATAPVLVEPYRPQAPGPIENIVGRKQYRLKWRSITLHHSATLEGNAEAFDRNHRKRRLGGLFYHFVIGNGTGSADGEIEVGWRWRRQVEVERRGDIEICLVGDFNKQSVSTSQLNSLVKLLSVLTEQYSIPLSKIKKHKDIVTKVTECPGERFPFYKVLAELKNGSG